MLKACAKAKGADEEGGGAQGGLKCEQLLVMELELGLVDLAGPSHGVEQGEEDQASRLRWGGLERAAARSRTLEVIEGTRSRQRKI